MEQKIKDLIEIYEHNIETDKEYIDLLIKNGCKADVPVAQAQIRLYMEVINDLQNIVEGK